MLCLDWTVLLGQCSNRLFQQSYALSHSTSRLPIQLESSSLQFHWSPYLVFSTAWLLFRLYLCSSVIYAENSSNLKRFHCVPTKKLQPKRSNHWTLGNLQLTMKMQRPRSRIPSMRNQRGYKSVHFLPFCVFIKLQQFCPFIIAYSLTRLLSFFPSTSSTLHHLNYSTSRV